MNPQQKTSQQPQPLKPAPLTPEQLRQISGGARPRGGNY